MLRHSAFVLFLGLGGVVALPLGGLSLSVSALVGFIALFGVSVQNGVLLVEHIRVLRREGLEMTKAVVEGAAARVRPVVMTAAMAAVSWPLIPKSSSKSMHRLILAQYHRGVNTGGIRRAAKT